MINFTTINSYQFWEKNIPELANFFLEMEDLEYWQMNEKENFPFLVVLETKLNHFTKFSSIVDNEFHFKSFLEILSYLKLGTFFYWIYEINKEQPSFIISCLLSAKQENNIYEKLFIERFQLLERYNFLNKIFNDNKVNLIRTIFPL